MDRRTLLRAVDFFIPLLRPDASVSFYGGEPLLAFEHLRSAVAAIRKKEANCETSPRFFLTSNGTLLTPRIADFLNANDFTVLLSWDGPLQGSQRGFVQETSLALEELRRRPRIRLETNTVIMPESVQRLCEALREIHACGIQTLHVTPDRSAPWTEKQLLELDAQLLALNAWMADLPPETGLPVASLRPRTRQGPYACPAASNRLALSPAGEIWGCYRFHDFFDDQRPHLLRDRYCLGTLESFIARFPDSLRERRAAYRRLRPAYYSTASGLCLNCREMDSCGVCPVPFGEGIVGYIPVTACRIEQIMRRRRRENLPRAREGNGSTTPPCG